jgi:hypothetical protein
MEKIRYPHLSSPFPLPCASSLPERETAVATLEVLSMSIYDVHKRGKVTQNPKISPRGYFKLLLDLQHLFLVAHRKISIESVTSREEAESVGPTIRNHLLFSKPLASAMLPKEPHFTLELIFVFRNTIRSYLRLVWKTKIDAKCRVHLSHDFTLLLQLF